MDTDLEAMATKDRDYLRNFTCAWCEQGLHRSECGDVFNEPCTQKDRAQRRTACLAERVRLLEDEVKGIRATLAAVQRAVVEFGKIGRSE